jgi:hypothetical protein
MNTKVTHHQPALLHVPATHQPAPLNIRATGRGAARWFPINRDELTPLAPLPPGDDYGLDPLEEALYAYLPFGWFNLARTEIARIRHALMYPQYIPIPLTGHCDTDCLRRCAYPGQFTECDFG